MRRYFNGRVQILDSLGDPVPGAKLEFFEAGTSNQQDTFTDFDLNTANTNPIICDSGGWCTVFMTPNVVYDYTAKDADDVLLYPKVVDVVSYEPPLTTKGDIFTFDTDWQRLPVGTDGYFLTADSSQATGLTWSTAADNTLTTKGDLYTYDTGNARLPVGNDGDILVVDSSEATGLKWRSVLKVSAYLGYNLALTQNVWTKIVFNVEDYDTAGAFANSKFTVPSGEDGYYLITANVGMGTFGDQDPFDVYMYKNGSARRALFGLGTSCTSAEIPYVGGSVIESLVASDYIEIYCRVEDTGINAIGSAGPIKTWIQIYRIA